MQHLRIATYNIHKGVQGLIFAKRLEIHNLGHAVEQFDADIVCLQEVRKVHHREAEYFTRWPDMPQADFLAPEGYEAVYRTNAFTKHGEHGNAMLSRWPVVEVVSLTDDGTALVEDTDFVVDTESGQVMRLSGGRVICWGCAPKVVQYDAGYEEIPGDLQDAVTRMVRNRFRAKGRDSYLMSENIPGIRESRWWIATGNDAGNIPPDIADLISSYRAPVIA